MTTRPRTVAAVLIAFVLVGLALRLPGIGNSLFGDEVGAFYDVTGHGFGHTLWLLDLHSPELSPPLFFELAQLTRLLFGTSPAALRLVSLAAGIATIPLTYTLGTLLCDRRTALAAAGLTALSPFLAFFSIEARPYALLTMLCLLATIGAVKGAAGGSWRWWALYGVSACAVMYTHYTGVFALAVVFVWTAVARPAARRPLLIATAGAAIAFAPWLPTLIRSMHSPGTQTNGLLEPFNAGTVRTTLGELWLGNSEAPVFSAPGAVGVALAAFGAAVAAAGCTLARAGAHPPDDPPEHGRRRRSELVLIIALALGVPLLTGLYSAVRTTIWDSRDLIASWPALALLIALLVMRARRPPNFVAAVAIVAALAIGAADLQRARFQRPDYRGAVALIDRTMPPGTPVVNWPDFSPGPPNELEVAFQEAGALARHPVVRLHAPTLAAVEQAPPYTLPPVPSGQDDARFAISQASRSARDGRRTTIALVLPSEAPVQALAAAARRRGPAASAQRSPLAALAAFLSALPPDATIAHLHTYPGLHRVSVYAIKLAG